VVRWRQVSKDRRLEKKEYLTLRIPRFRLRVRTLLILVASAALVLGGTRTALRSYRAKRYQQDVLNWADWRNRYQEKAERFRTGGNTAGAAKQERLAAYCEEWRRIMEHAASTGEIVYVSSGPSRPK
jgi:hypothetical protein